jgi:hypothetical protein
MTIYRLKAQGFEAMQHTGSNDQAMVDWAPEVLSQDIAARKLYFEWPAGNKHEVLATTWIVKRNDWWENVRDQYFQKTYEEVPSER